MQRFPSYVGVGAALGIFVISVILANEFSVQTVVTSPSPTASSTLLVESSFEGLSLPLLSLPTPEGTTTESTALGAQAAQTVQKSFPKKMAEVQTKPSVSAPVSTTQIVTPPPVPTNAELDAAAAILRAALINIICLAPVGSGLHSISGSGVFIDQKGIILTNAHIAQYFLLADRSVTCTIRSGSPAVERYSANLIYISPAWLRENASILRESQPSGTGEFDFALLAVSKSADGKALPDSFPFIPLAKGAVLPQTPVVIASYGAQFLDSSQVRSSLSPTVVFGSVKNILTFATTTIDVLSLGGSAAAQEGSSGGGVSDAFGNLVGSIMTSTITGDTASRTLNALSAAYIRREYTLETEESLDTLLNQPTVISLNAFAQKASTLEAIITAHFP